MLGAQVSCRCSGRRVWRIAEFSRRARNLKIYEGAAAETDVAVARSGRSFSSPWRGRGSLGTRVAPSPSRPPPPPLWQKALKSGRGSCPGFKY